MRLEMRRTLSGYEAGILVGAVDLTGWKDHRVWSAWEQEQNAGVGGHAAGKWNVLGNPLPSSFRLLIKSYSLWLEGWGCPLFAGGSQSSYSIASKGSTVPLMCTMSSVWPLHFGFYISGPVTVHHVKFHVCFWWLWVLFLLCLWLQLKKVLCFQAPM